FLWWFIREPRREGTATLAFAIWYGCARLLEDSLRIDKRFGPLTGSQWTALVVALLSASILLWWRFHPLPPSADMAGDEVADPEDRESEAQDEPEPDPLT